MTALPAKQCCITHLEAEAGSQVANRVLFRAAVVMIIAACCRFQGAATPCEAHLAHGESAAACVLRRASAPLVTDLKHG